MDMFHVFPTELCERIVELLSVQDLLSCSLVSKLWRKIINMDHIWKSHCHKKQFIPKTIEQIDPKYLVENEDEDMSKLNLTPLCRWRRVFAWHNRLRNNWIERNFKRHSLSSEKCESPVFCLHSDGKLVVSGHEDGSINVWIACEKPKHYCMFFGALSSVPIISVYVWNIYLVVLQRRLLQIYKKDDNHGYMLKDAKTFELGTDEMSLIGKIKILGESFDYWYKECLRLNEQGHFELRRLMFVVAEGLLMTAVGGSGELGVWRMDGSPRASLSGFHSIRSLLVLEEQVFVVSDRGEDTYLSRYSSARGESEQLLRVPGWKKIVLSERFYIAVPNRMDTTLKRMWVWDRGLTLLRTKKLAFGQVSVAPVRDLIVYTENSQVTVWNPKTDEVLNTFSAAMTIGFIKPAFSTLLVMFMNASVHVWDFVEGKRLYRIYSELEWHGDFRDQLWLSASMIIAGGIEKQMEMLSFMD